jgi:hypothetical protein
MRKRSECVAGVWGCSEQRRFRTIATIHAIAQIVPEFLMPLDFGDLRLLERFRPYRENDIDAGIARTVRIHVCRDLDTRLARCGENV